MLASHLPGALHDAFLTFAQQESEQLREALDELTRQAIHVHSEQVRRRLLQATLRLVFRGPTIYLDPPSLALEAPKLVIPPRHRWAARSIRLINPRSIVITTISTTTPQPISPL